MAKQNYRQWLQQRQHQQGQEILRRASQQPQPPVEPNDPALGRPLTQAILESSPQPKRKPNPDPRLRPPVGASAVEEMIAEEDPDNRPARLTSDTQAPNESEEEDETDN